MIGRISLRFVTLLTILATIITVFCSTAICQETCTTLNEMQIISHDIKEYDIYFDGDYVGTEGINGDTPDGSFTVYNIPCWSNHTILVDDGILIHTLDSYFGGGMPYVIVLDDPLFVVGPSQGQKGHPENYERK